MTARELTTGTEPLTATIKSFGGLSQDRANVIIEEAKKFGMFDERFKRE